MREYKITAQEAGKRLDRWLSAQLPALPMGLVQKSIRLKKVKLNGKAAHPDDRLQEGDTLHLYLDDASFEKPKQVDPFLSKIHPKLNILYEDENLMLADKRPGLACHPDDKEKVNTLITHVQAYLYQKGEYDSMDKQAFAPALCNRIDRFTGGIVIIAKTEAALHILNQKIRDHEIEKHYLCILHGKITPPSGTLTHYLFKPKGAKKVTVVHPGTPGAQRAQTIYQTLDSRGGLSLVECTLVTGRTHQIRAQFAAKGHPLLGDNQYGSAKQDEKYHRTYQALYAYRIVFSFKTDAGILNPLKGRSWHVKSVPFVQEYFPDKREDT